MAFAEAFRKKVAPHSGHQVRTHHESPRKLFVNDVHSYPMILIASKRVRDERDLGQAHGRRWRAFTLEELGCIVRVGPALGHTPAFVLMPDEKDVE